MRSKWQEKVSSSQRAPAELYQTIEEEPTSVLLKLREMGKTGSLLKSLYTDGSTLLSKLGKDTRESCRPVPLMNIDTESHDCLAWRRFKTTWLHSLHTSAEECWCIFLSGAQMLKSWPMKMKMNKFGLRTRVHGPAILPSGESQPLWETSPASGLLI